jgi:hypothetical protein
MKSTLKRQKQPKAHRYRHSRSFYRHFSAKSDTNINKPSTTFFTCSRSNLNTKNTLFGHGRTKPATSYRNGPKHSNSSTKRSVNRRHHARPTPRQENHPTFAYPPIHETFFDDNDDDYDHENEDDEPPQVPLASPDALTSSTRTDFTYPPIEGLTRTLLKYAKTANLWKLSYPTASFHNDDKSIPSWTIYALSATFHHGQDAF